MQVKVFEAEDMATALKKVKETLGPDALILSTRTVKKGGMGLLGRSVLEVTAAVEKGTASEPDPMPVKEQQPVQPANSYSAEPPIDFSALNQNLFQGQKKQDDLNYGDLWRKRKVIDPLEEEIEHIKGTLSNLNVDSLRDEINELKELVKGMAQPRVEYSAPPSDDSSLLGRIIDELRGRGINAQTASLIAQDVCSRSHDDESWQHLEALITAAVADKIHVSGPLSKGKNGPKCVALVGPTGVGKTTTIAKLAADHLVKRGRSVALVTIDIYRIAAAEQLKVYGEIMRIPVEVVFTPEQLGMVLATHQDKELILIDTAGRSPRDGAGIDELAQFIGSDFISENHLVLSATTREQEIHGAIEQFGRLPIHNYIFTKLDECENLGIILNVLMNKQLPLSYMTNGQRVPEDLLLAQPEEVAKLIWEKG